MNNFFLSCKECRIEGPRSFYGSFYLGPFNGSQSLTVANALRRTLLSELTGISITSVLIQGAKHEFSTLVGVRESVLDILLNLKEIVLKSNSSFTRKKVQTQVGYLYVYGPGVVRASDLKLPASIQCVDPNQYIATLSQDGVLIMKFTINEGKNFMQKTKLNKDFFSNQKTSNLQNEPAWKDEGLPMLLDAVFMPVNKVNYIIEPYVQNPGMSLMEQHKITSEKTNFSELKFFGTSEQKNNMVEINKNLLNNTDFTLIGKPELQIVILEIWTNGSLHPRTALYQGLTHLMNLFSQLEKMKTLNSMFTKLIYTDNTVFEKTFETLESEYEYYTQLENGGKKPNFQNELRNRFSYEEQKENSFFNSNLKNISIHDLNLSNRSFKLLQRSNITTLFDLINSSEKTLKNIPGFGEKCLQEVKSVVNNLGFSLKVG